MEAGQVAAANDDVVMELRFPPFMMITSAAASLLQKSVPAGKNGGQDSQCRAERCG
jgi:hypothetical protein